MVSEESFAYSDVKVGPVVLLCTGTVVVMTLAVNGTTTGWLLQWLGLTRPEVSVQVAVRRARRHIREQCMAVYHEHLTGDDVMGTASFRVVSEMVPFLSAVEDEIEQDLKGNGNGGSGGRGQEGAESVDDKTTKKSKNEPSSSASSNGAAAAAALVTPTPSVEENLAAPRGCPPLASSAGRELSTLSFHSIHF